MTAPFDTVSIGDERSFEVPSVSRTDFVRYAGASGDFNPIHHDEGYAQTAGLPGVFGMGMFTAGVLSRVVTDWFGPQHVKRYGVRFTSRLWPGDTLTCRGTVTGIYEEDGVRHVALALTASNQTGEVLVQADAIVRPWVVPQG